jgi:hypothetical protein
MNLLSLFIMDLIVSVCDFSELMALSYNRTPIGCADSGIRMWSGRIAPLFVASLWQFIQV